MNMRTLRIAVVKGAAASLLVLAGIGTTLAADPPPRPAQ
jgi:hypothetical protein